MRTAHGPGPLLGAQPLSYAFKPARVNPIKLAYTVHTSAGPIAVSDRLGQYDSSSGTGPLLLRRTRRFFPNGTHCAYPRRDEQAEWLG